MANYDRTLSLGRRIGEADLGSVIIGAGLFCFLLSVFFSSLIPEANLARNGSLAAVDCIALLRHVRKGTRFRFLAPGIFLGCFLVFAVLNHGSRLISGGDRSWFTLFLMCLAAAILLKNDSVNWIRLIAELIAVFALVHAVATVLFFAVPNLYSGWFKPHFYPSTLTASSYKAGLTSHYSTNGMYLAWGLISAFYLWQASARLGGRKWLILFVVILVAVLLTTKRAHLVFGAVSCLVVYLLLNSGKGAFGTTFKIAAFAVGALAVFYIASLYVPEIAGVVERLDGAELDDGRTGYYEICFQLFGTSPLFGHGWGAFTNALYQSGISDLARLYRNGNLDQNAHNVYLQLLAEEGLAGFALFVGFAITSLVYSVRAALADSCGRAGGLYALSAGIQVFFLLYSITGNPLYSTFEYPVYLLLGASLTITAGVAKSTLLSNEQPSEGSLDKT